MHNNKITIGLLWHSFSSDNLGVGALSLCNIRLIDEQARAQNLDPEYIVVGNTGSCDYLPEAFRGNTRLVHFPGKAFLKTPLRIINAISACDIVFDIGEGDSYADIYGLSRFIKLSLSKAISIRRRTPLILSPQTIGPFGTSVGRVVSRYLLPRARVVIARDHMSKALLDKMGLKNAVESTDVAFSLQPEGQTLPESGGKIRFGLNVSGLLYNGGYNGKNQFSLKSDYRAFTHQLVSELASRDDLEIHLVPHVISTQLPVEDDYSVSELIKQQHPSIILPERFRSPSEAKGYIAQMDVFAGARMHSTVAAFSSGTPVLPLAYSRKFSGLFESMQYNRALDMRDLDEQQLINAIKAGIRDRHVLAAEMTAGRERFQLLLNDYRAIIASALQDGSALARKGA